VVRRLFLTPPELPETSASRCLVIPDDKLWFGLVSEALLTLTKTYNYEQRNDTDLTPQEVVDVMLVMFDTYLLGECTSECVCTIPPAFDIDVGIELRIIRRGANGFIEELVDGEWVTPTGDYEQPETPAREEGTATDRICMASINAATIIEEFYEQATDAYATFATPAAVADAILGAIVLVMGAFGQVTAASHISFGQNLFSTFVDAFELITGDVWDAAFTEEFACILREHATDTSDVVTFDFDALDQELITLEYEAGGDLDRQILLAQLRYLLSLTGAAGLNLAGSATDVTSYDCDYCDPWEHTFNFINNTQGFSNVVVTNADHSNYCTTGTSNNTNGANGWAIRKSPYKHVGLTFSLAHITKFSITYNNQEGAVDFYLFNKDDAYDYWSSNEVASRHSSATGAQTYTSGDIDVMANQVAMARCTVNDNFCNWSSLTLWGDGFDPFA